MTGDFRQYLFRTPDQWNHGVGFRLQTITPGGFQLFSSPAFQSWVVQVDAARAVPAVDVDECGRVLWLHRHDGHLYRIDPSNGLVQQLIEVVCPSSEPHAFGRVMQSKGRIWIHDRQRERLLALRADTFQIVIEMDVPAAIDVALGGGRLFALEDTKVRSFDSDTGRPLHAFEMYEPKSPVAVGADPRGKWIHVIDRCHRGFRRFAMDGRYQGQSGRFDDVAPTFVPTLLCVDGEGNLFVSDGSARIHQFAPDGGYIGDTGAMGPIEHVSALTFGADGTLYVGEGKGIARLGRDGGVAGNAGQFNSGTLDKGGRDDEWHRLDVVADIRDGGAVDVYYAASDESMLADRVAAILAQPTGASEKAAAIDQILEDRWRGPYQLRALPTLAATDASPVLNAEPTHSVLFDKASGRYLWLKMVLFGLTRPARAAVREVRVYYPRLSYLRYLPAVYQEDKSSREFLERYLSIFETVMSGLEETIGRTSEVIDPRHTPAEFLDWLAQWLDIAVEEDWPDTVKRQLIERASRLYERKGTPAGLAEFIEIVTGRRPLIRESFDTERPSVLGTSAPLGSESRLAPQPVEERPPLQYTRLGARTLGTSQIRSDTTTPLNAFVAAAHRFTVVLSLSPQEYRRHAPGLHRVIREQSPAHTAYELRVDYAAGLGAQAVVGVNWRVVDPQPVQLGYSMLGVSICCREVSYGPELGVDATLVERADCGMSGCN